MQILTAFCCRCVVGVISVLCVIAYSTISACAGGWTQPKGTLFLKAWGGWSTAGSYYDNDGNLIAEQPPFETSQPDDTVRQRVRVADEFSAVLGGVYGEYGLTDDITAILDVPIGYFELTRKADVHTQTSEGITRQGYDTLYSITAPVYAGIGVRYKVQSSEKMTTSLAAMLKIPPGFSKPIRNNPNYPFLSDGALEFRIGGEVGIPSDFGWVGLHAFYNWRDEELKDELLLHAEAGFNRVENAFFKLHMDLVQSLASFGSDVQFVSRETQLQENYLSAGASFMLFLSKEWFIDADYSVRIFGANTWNLSTFTLGGGMLLPSL